MAFCHGVLRFVGLCGKDRAVREITGLRGQQRNKERANLYLDGAYAFSITMLQAARLKVGQQLSDAEVAELRQQAETDKAYDRALRFLTYRPRSEAEVVKYLVSKGVAQDARQEIMGRLRRLGLVDDEAFARFWVESREHSRPSGRLALRSELRLKGIGDGVIESVLQGIDQEESAHRAALKQARRYATLDDRVTQQKLGAFLMRRGFPYSVAKATVKRLVEEIAAEGHMKEESEVLNENG